MTSSSSATASATGSTTTSRMDLDEIESLLDAMQFVSVKYFANHMNYPITQARSIMNTFKEKHPATMVSLLVSGSKCTNGDTATAIKSYSVTLEDKLDEERSKYVDNTVKVSLYGLQALLSKEQTATQYYFQDIEQTNDLLLKQVQCNATVKNELGAIKFSGLSVADVGSKQRNLVVAAAAVRDAAKVDSGPLKSLPTAARGPSPNPSAAVKMPAKPAAAVANFFAKSTASTSSSSATPSTSGSASFFKKIKSDPPPSIAPAAEKLSAKPNTPTTVTAITAVNTTDSVEVLNDSESEAEWDDGTGSKFRPDKTKVTKSREEEQRLLGRKRLNINDEKENHVNDVRDSEAAVVDSPDQEDEVNVAHGKFLKHGAMDDYLEDVAIAKEKQRVQEHGADSLEPTKKKRRKLVEKVVPQLYCRLLTFTFCV
jgi:hypothetical protein